MCKFCLAIYYHFHCLYFKILMNAKQTMEAVATFVLTLKDHLSAPVILASK